MMILHCLSLLLLCRSSLGYTKAPIIGVLSQEDDLLVKKFPNFRSLIAASYVKSIESAGGRVIPIWIGQNESYYKDIVTYTNGIFFPGGDAHFHRRGGYADAGQFLYNLAVEMNDKGDYYPVWGTCLGMELLTRVATNHTEIRAQCSADEVSLPLTFAKDAETSRLFKNVPPRVMEILSTHNITYNHHDFCVTEQNFTEVGMDKNWRILSYSNDVNGLKFVSSFESRKYPFYAVQFHIEKAPYEFLPSLNISHSKESTELSYHFASFFVEEAKKNDHHFPDWKTEEESLIYNYQPLYSGRMNFSFVQVYVFKDMDFDHKP